MHFSTLFLVTLSVVSVRADLTCLEWGLISPIVGLVCHFAPETYNKAEAATVATVKSTVDDVKDLVEFDVTHNPGVIIFNYLTAPDPDAYLADTLNDYAGVTIGFAKETANQVVQLVELTHWSDASFCLMRSAAQSALTQNLGARSQRAKRQTPEVVDDALAIATGCIGETFNALAQPKVFNITDPDQRVGATISDIASLLIPIGEEAKVGEIVSTEVDLTFRGAEDTSRIYKKVADEGVAEHFANKAEAQSVADNLKDPAWKEQNCGVCGLPATTIGVPGRRRLNRRGLLTGVCCAPPQVVPDLPIGDLDTPIEYSDELEEEIPEEAPPIYDSSTYGMIPEAAVTKPPPDYTIRNLAVDADVEAIRLDLKKLNTGATAWSEELTNIMSSEQLFTELREIFTASADDARYQGLRVQYRDGGAKMRLTSFSSNWINIDNPAIAHFQQFAKTAIDEGINSVGRLYGWTPEVTEALKADGEVTGHISFFYTIPTEAIEGSSIEGRGVHMDKGIMQFGAADRPGLVVKNDIDGKLSRVPIKDNAFFLLKAREWNLADWSNKVPNTATWHTVFGPEMAQDGRVSMVMTIFDPQSPFLV